MTLHAPLHAPVPSVNLHTTLHDLHGSSNPAGHTLHGHIHAPTRAYPFTRTTPPLGGVCVKGQTTDRSPEPVRTTKDQ